METSKQRKRHSKNYKENVEKAKKQIKEAEEGMKKMDQEVKEFHSRMTNSMAQLMKTFSEGFEALDKAKKDDPDLLAKKPETQTLVKETKATKPETKG
jgi:multidrug resistance efflux pump